MKKSTREYSRAQEERVAKALGGKVVANSGATAFNKGDVILDDWMIECKTVTKEREQVTIKKEWIDKNKQEAIGSGKMFQALAFDFGDGEDFYIINERMMQILVRLLDEQE